MSITKLPTTKLATCPEFCHSPHRPDGSDWDSLTGTGEEVRYHSSHSWPGIRATGPGVVRDAEVWVGTQEYVDGHFEPSRVLVTAELGLTPAEACEYAAQIREAAAVAEASNREMFPSQHDQISEAQGAWGDALVATAKVYNADLKATADQLGYDLGDLMADQVTALMGRLVADGGNPPPTSGARTTDRA